jgi:uncharacterized protein involved in response to NO
MTTTAQARREYSGPALFEYGFRPFFLGAGLVAAGTIPAWLAMLAFGWAPGLPLDPLDWHIHEMIFGFIAAVVAGFLLTAIPNWTGRLPVAGWPLAGLSGLWLLGRLAMDSPVLPESAAAPLDAAFLVLMAAFAWREVIAGGSTRNAPVCGLVTIFALANIVFHAEVLTAVGPGLSVRLALSAIMMLIALIGGRITPSFTLNWLGKRGDKDRPAPFGWYDKAALAVLVVALIAWIAAPVQYTTGGLLALAGVLHGLRLARWCGWQARVEPLLFILHVGYAWLPLSLLLLGLAALPAQIMVGSAAVHAATAGLIGTMTLAVMTRATLGHTRRPLTAGPLTVLIYVLVVAGAIIRVVAPYLPFDYLAALVAGGALWSASFALFALVYGRMLVTAALPRGPDGRGSEQVR